MKIVKFLLIALACCAALQSCGNNDNGGPVYGEVIYDGKTMKINSLIYESISLPGMRESYKIFQLANVTPPKNGERFGTTVCALNLPAVDYFGEVEMTGYALWEVTFTYGNNQYVKYWEYEGDIPRNTYIHAVKSLGIDPVTGKEIKWGENHSEIFMTGGYVRWKTGEKTGRLDFNLEFEDGKTAKGYANIPMSTFR